MMYSTLESDQTAVLTAEVETLRAALREARADLARARKRIKNYRRLCGMLCAADLKRKSELYKPH